MEFTFETIALRKICMSAKQAEKKFGLLVTQKLHQKLDDLKAAQSLIDLPSKTIKNTEQINPDFLYVSLADGYILKFKPCQLNIPIDEAGVILLSKIYRIKFIAIEKKNA